MLNAVVIALALCCAPRHHAIASRDARNWQVTVASHYATPPAACYDGPKNHRVAHTPPRNLRVWTAHKTLPCGTSVEVRYGGRTIVAPVWDRGPYARGRDLDLSAAAFAKLAPLKYGVLTVLWRVKVS